MQTFVLLYITKLALALMLIPLFKDYKKREMRHVRVKAWRDRRFGENSSRTTLF